MISLLLEGAVFCSSDYVTYYTYIQHTRKTDPIQEMSEQG
ncbi:hypothetical protein AAZX31_01G181000 [Glycine max]